MSNLEKVVEFMHCANQPTPVTPAIPHEDRVKLRLKLISEEFKELEKAIEDKNLVEIMDAFCDLEYVLLGAVIEFGMFNTFQKNFNLVHNSNMTKFDNSESDAFITKELYNKGNVETYCKQVGKRWVTFRQEDNKVLKSHKYKPVTIEI